MTNNKYETIEDYGLTELQLEEVSYTEEYFTSENKTKFRPDFTVEDLLFGEVEISSQKTKFLN